MNVGVFRVERAQALVKDPGGGGQRGDVEVAAPAGLHLLELHLAAVGELDDLQRVGQKGAARVRQRNAALVAHEQPRAKLLFQLADMVADGGLGQAVAACRLGEIQRLGDGNKVPKLIDIHIGAS